MGEYVLRAAPGSDLYALYSTVSENITFIGTREEVRIGLSTPTWDRGVDPLREVAERLDRTDQTGTSVRFGNPPYGAFDDSTLDIADHERAELCVLRRSRLAAYLQALADGDEDTARALLEPRFPDQDDVMQSAIAQLAHDQGVGPVRDIAELATMPDVGDDEFRDFERGTRSPAPSPDTLFGVEPPDGPLGGQDDYVEWYGNLKDTTARILMFIVDRHREQVAPFSFADPELLHRCAFLARTFFDNEVRVNEISAGLRRVAIEAGLITAGPSARDTTSHPAGPLNIDDALKVVDEAFRGRWSHLQKVMP